MFFDPIVHLVFFYLDHGDQDIDAFEQDIDMLGSQFHPVLLDGDEVVLHGV